jgi:hypothetical protein
MVSAGGKGAFKQFLNGKRTRIELVRRKNREKREGRAPASPTSIWLTC